MIPRSETHTTPQTETGPLVRRDLHLLFFFPEREPIYLAPGDSLTLGRAHPCLRGDPEISGEHIRLERTQGLFTVSDLGSKNGTFVDGEQIPAKKAVPLEVGQILRVGGHVGLLVQHQIEKPWRFFSLLSQEGTSASHALFGSEQMAAVAERIQQIAQDESSVIIEGETGTGKEGAARLLHQWRGIKKPFFAFDCGAIPAELLESELFGHVRGGFTGAIRSREGYLSQAGEGTLFLDELLELSMGAQAKLLRALQEREFRPVGTDQARPLKARLVAALQGSFEEALGHSLREDLGFRLGQVRLRLPPLRERREDIYWLFRLFFARRLGLARTELVTPPSAAFVERLVMADFPGNVRQLEALAYQVASQCSKDQPHPRRHHLQPLLPRPVPDSLEALLRVPFGRLTEEQRERLRGQLEAVLRQHRGKILSASKALHVPRSTLRRVVLEQLKMNPAEYE